MVKTKKPQAPSRNLTGLAIKRIRMTRKPNITQEDMVGRLARQEMHLTQAQIAKLENGNRPINDFELAAIARALRVPVQRIFDEARSMRAAAARHARSD